MNKTLHELIEIIRTKSTMQSLKELSEYDTLGALLYEAIQQSMKEVSRGADPREFGDNTILNLLILGTIKGFTTEELSTFIADLKSDYHDHDSIECDENCTQNHYHDDFDERYHIDVPSDKRVRENESNWDDAWSSNEPQKIMKRDGIIVRPATQAEIARMDNIPTPNKTKQESSSRNKKTFTESERAEIYDEYMLKMKKMALEREAELLRPNTLTPPKVSPQPRIKPTEASLPTIREEEEEEEQPETKTVQKISQNLRKGIAVGKNVAHEAGSILHYLIERIRTEKEDDYSGVDIDSIELPEERQYIDYNQDPTFNPETFKEEAPEIEFKGKEIDRTPFRTGSNGEKRYI